MLRYRVLLVEPDSNPERPTQAFLNTVTSIQDWARSVLRKASKDAYVKVYRVIETEVAIMRKDDQGAIQGFKPAEEKADQPV